MCDWHILLTPFALRPYFSTDKGLLRTLFQRKMLFLKGISDCFIFDP